MRCAPSPPLGCLPGEARRAGLPGGRFVFSNKGSVLCLLGCPDCRHATVQPRGASARVGAHCSCPRASPRGAAPQTWMPETERQVRGRPPVQGAPLPWPLRILSPARLATDPDRARQGESTSPSLPLGRNVGAVLPPGWLRRWGQPLHGQANVICGWERPRRGPWAHVGCDGRGPGSPKLSSSPELLLQVSQENSWAKVGTGQRGGSSPHVGSVSGPGGLGQGLV